MGEENYDFFQYYAAGHDWSIGLDPYHGNPGTPGRMGQPQSPTLFGFIYPPPLLPALVILSTYPYAVARTIWLAVNLALLALSLVVAAVASRPHRLDVLAIGLLLTALSHPLLYHVRQGQIDLIVAGLATTAFILYGRARAWPTAALLAAAICIKVTPLVILLSLAAYYRDRRLLLKTATCLTIVVVVSWLWVSPHLYYDYATWVLPEVSQGNSFHFNQSLLRLWAHTYGLVRLPSVAGYAGVVLISWAVGRSRPTSGANPSDDAIALYAMTVLGMLLFSPLSWHMAYVWIIVPFALFLGRSWASIPLRIWLLAASGVALMLMPLKETAVLDSVNMIGALAAMGSLLWATAIRSRSVHAER